MQCSEFSNSPSLALGRSYGVALAETDGCAADGVVVVIPGEGTARGKGTGIGSVKRTPIGGFLSLGKSRFVIKYYLSGIWKFFYSFCKGRIKWLAKD